MVVGVMRVSLYSSDPRSLKDKRRIVKSLIERIKNKFNVSAAEIGFLDSWNECGIGISCVSNEASHADSMLSSVINFIESSSMMEVTDYTTELVHFD